MQKKPFTPPLLHPTLKGKGLANKKLRLLASILLLLSAGFFSPAWAAVTIGSNYVIIGGTNTAANGTYYTNITNSSADKGSFANIVLGSFDRGLGSLTLNARATTSQSGSDAVQSVQLFYRVYAVGSTPPATYTALSLNNAVSTGNGNNRSTTWTTSVSPPNLLTATSAGTYKLDLYFQIVSTNNQGNVTNYFDRTSANPYTTNFSVTGQAAATWLGTTNDWFLASNWSPAVVPTEDTDVTITLQQGSAMRYPTITGTNGRVAKARTLRLNNSSAPNTIILTINSGELQVFGDFQNPNGGLKQNNGAFTLAGTTQTFDGASFTDFRVQGGGTKTLTNRMDVVNSLTFLNGGGILSTNTTSSDVFNVDLGTNAQVAGEDETSYVLGILRATNRIILRGTTNTCGNIGIEITTSASAPDDPGYAIITRRTGLAYTGAGTASTSQSVTRSFTFSSIDSPDNQLFTLVFRYLNTELNGLNANKLGFYRSASGMAPFDDLNRASNGSKVTTSNTITGTLAATFTLGETAAPLPVTLVSFTAIPTAQGGALLRWATASEINNKGFGIERQLANDGAWQQVGYLASGNNKLGGSYSYTDKSLATAAASPQAYYRLRQEDLDGTLSYSPVAVVARTTATISTELILSPVPATGASISLAFAEAAQAGSDITITSTSGQRLLNYTTQASNATELSLPIEKLAPGVYIVSVRVPGQALRYARFVKL